MIPANESNIREMFGLGHPNDGKRQIHLCGSRLLRTDDAFSDWDFVTTHTPEICGELEAAGFKRMPSKAAYEGDYCEAVYEKKLEGVTVQVSVEIDAKYKLAIMKAMQSCRPLLELDMRLRGVKPVRDVLWQTLYKLVMNDRSDAPTCTMCDRAIDKLTGEPRGTTPADDIAF